MTHLAGMRVGEVAALRIGDVLSEDGRVRSEIRLLPEQTKGSRARTVFLNERLQKEVTAHVATLKHMQGDMPLFYTQKRLAFSANTLCQHFHFLYKEAGIDGASSHSGRRTFITNLASKGVGVRVLIALAGHQNIATTQRYIALDRRSWQACADLIDKFLQPVVVDIGDVQFAELGQYLAIQEVLIVAMALSGHFFAHYASGLCLHKAAGTSIKASVFDDGNAVVFVDQQLLVKRNRGLDGLAFIGLASAAFDRAIAVEEPDLPERASGHAVDFELVRVALDGFERIRDRDGTRWMRSRGLLCRRHSCSYWSCARSWRAGM